MKKPLSFLVFCAFMIGLSSASFAESATPKVLNKKVQGGDTVYGILKRVGFNHEQRNAALAQSPLPKGFILAPGDIYQVVKESGLMNIRFFDRFKNLSYSFWKKSDDAGAKREPASLKSKVVTVDGKVVGSIVGSIRRAVGDEMLAYRFMDAFLLDVNMKKLQKGAKFHIKYEKLFAGNQFIRLGEVHRAELEVKGKKLVREFQPLKRGGVFIAHRDNHDSRPLYAPVDYIRISSLYQPRRFHPIKKYRKAHLGIDFELPEGENVYSVQSGTVLRFGRTRGAGRYVVIKHKNGLESYYNHMSSLSKNLKKGGKIRAGVVIGKIGCTGYCTKPHLHFAVKKHGRFVNPQKLLKRYTFGQRWQGKKIAKLD